MAELVIIIICWRSTLKILLLEAEEEWELKVSWGAENHNKHWGGNWDREEGK